MDVSFLRSGNNRIDPSHSSLTVPFFFSCLSLSGSLPMMTTRHRSAADGSVSKINSIPAILRSELSSVLPLDSTLLARTAHSSSEIDFVSSLFLPIRYASVQWMTSVDAYTSVEDGNIYQNDLASEFSQLRSSYRTFVYPSIHPSIGQSLQLFTSSYSIHLLVHSMIV